MVNFNLSEEEKNRIRSLHESHKKLHGTMVAEQATTTPPSGAKPSTGTPQTTPPANAQSKYKLPEITDDNKFKTFISINGTEDMRPTGLLAVADQWFKTNYTAKKGTISQQEYVKGMQAWSTWSGQLEAVAKALLSMAAFQGINAEAFKTVGDDVIIRFLDTNKIPKPIPNMDWSENMQSGVGGMQVLKNGMSKLITNQLNKIK